MEEWCRKVSGGKGSGMGEEKNGGMELVDLVNGRMVW